MNNQNNTIMKLAQTALLAALCYVSYSFCYDIVSLFRKKGDYHEQSK